MERDLRARFKFASHAGFVQTTDNYVAPHAALYGYVNEVSLVFFSLDEAVFYETRDLNCEREHYYRCSNSAELMVV